METGSLITEFPDGYRDVDVEYWIDYLAMMHDNLLRGEIQTYSVVGIDSTAFWINRGAFQYLCAKNGIDVTFSRIRQIISLESLLNQDRVFLLNPAPLPGTFMELKQGSMAIPMDDTEDAISDHYDAGSPIWHSDVNIRRFTP